VYEIKSIKMGLLSYKLIYKKSELRYSGYWFWFFSEIFSPNIK